LKLFEDKIWLVTGAASGMGRATTKAAITAGATVIATDINEAGLLSLAEQMGNRCVPLKFDVCSESDIGAAAALVERIGERLDVLVNNAGAARLEHVVDLTVEAIDFQYEVLLRGPMLLVRSLLPFLHRSDAPCIVNISSIGAVVNVSAHAAYASFKAGLEKFSRITLREHHGIRVNIIQPGFIDTPLLRNYGTEEQLKGILDEVAARVPVERIGTPEDIANAVLFLASPAASYINGAELLVDGGYCAGPFDFSP